MRLAELVSLPSLLGLTLITLAQPASQPASQFLILRSRAKKSEQRAGATEPNSENEK